MRRIHGTFGVERRYPTMQDAKRRIGGALVGELRETAALGLLPWRCRLALLITCRKQWVVRSYNKINFVVLPKGMRCSCSPRDIAYEASSIMKHS